MRDLRHDFVELKAPFRLDIRYARPDNFMGIIVYPSERAFLQRPAYESLLKAQTALNARGYGILVFDGYRPWSVTKIFWDRATEEQRKYLANPERGSIHNRGCAIDCSLYRLSTGLEVKMPSEFDEMNEKAWSDYVGGSEEERACRDLLISEMTAAGFRGIKHEWWHFNHPSAADYPIYDVGFSEIETRS